MASWMIPTTSISRLAEGDRGIAVWALQRALGFTDADGVFGPITKGSVESYQRAKALDVDGVAGPITQRSLLLTVIARRASGTPDGLVRGIGLGESGLTFGAVNWSVPGGVDVGAFQRRLQLFPLPTDSVIQWGFDAEVQAALVTASLIKQHNSFLGLAGTNDAYHSMSAQEKAWRLAALDHNYPAGALRLAQTPISALPSSWTSPQTWVTDAGYHFPDGAPVRTPLDWTHLYAGVLAGAHGTTGSVTKYVTNWAA
jgi:hypothetical protein